MSAFPGPITPLPALPDFAPNPDLWARIERRHRSRQRSRWVVGAASIGAVVLISMLAIRIPSPLLGGDLLAQQRVEASQLELDWQALAVDHADGYSQLLPLDVALQQAYDRRADGFELVQLWNQRNQLLRELIRTRRDGSEFDAFSGGSVSL